MGEWGWPGVPGKGDAVGRWVVLTAEPQTLSEHWASGPLTLAYALKTEATASLRTKLQSQVGFVLNAHRGGPQAAGERSARKTQFHLLDFERNTLRDSDADRCAEDAVPGDLALGPVLDHRPEEAGPAGSARPEHAGPAALHLTWSPQAAVTQNTGRGPLPALAPHRPRSG